MAVDKEQYVLNTKNIQLQEVFWYKKHTAARSVLEHCRKCFSGRERPVSLNAKNSYRCITDQQAFYSKITLVQKLVEWHNKSA